MDQVHMDALLALSKGPTGRGIHLPNALTVQKSYDILTITTQPPKEFRDNSLRETFVLEYHQDGSLLQRTYRLNETSWQVETQLTDIQWVLQQFPKGIPDFSMEKYLDEACLKDAIWRTRREGDYIPLKEGRQKLKDLLINEKVPRLLRDRIPVLAVGSHVLWAVGLRISEEAKVSKTTRHVVVVRVNSTEETDRRKQC